MGPIITILLSDFDKTKYNLLDNFIKKIGTLFDSSSKISDWKFAIKKGTLLERRIETQNCLFKVSASDFVEFYDESEKIQIINKLGIIPTAEIGLCAMCNDSEDHKILALIALECLQMFGGYINLCGLVYPPIFQNSNSSKYTEPTIEEIRTSVNQINGRIIEIAYNGDNGKVFYKHIVDHEFFSNWIQSPHFYLVK